MRSPKVLSRSEVWKGSNLTWSRTHHRSFKYTPNLRLSESRDRFCAVLVLRRRHARLDKIKLKSRQNVCSCCPYARMGLLFQTRSYMRTRVFTQIYVRTCACTLLIYDVVPKITRSRRLFAGSRPAGPTS